VKLLLDTHALVWWFTSPERLSARAMAAISDPANEIVVSAASAYEVEYKRDRDAVLSQVPERLTSAVADQGFLWAPITPEAAVAAARLAPHHRDPWDRIIVAQALAHEAVLVTADRMLAAYGVPVLW
jgi:PIN domain nuclease of toxin-antitoxin system